MSIARKYKILGALCPVLIILDQITKQLVHARFRLGESIPVIEGYFHFTYVRNTGAAFGILADADPAFRVPFFLIVPVVALGLIFFMFRQVPDRNVRLSIALSAVLAGAVGNLIDRAIYGYVIDFLDFHWRYQIHFPAFNVADSSICVGVGIMFLDMFLSKDEKETG